MPAFAEITARHGPTLVLDAASGAIQVGLLRPGAAPAWERPAGDAGVGIFAGTETALGRAHLDLGAINAFIYCEGPGSMLGIRTVAMAIRTWQALRPRPAYRYQSLALAAHHVWKSHGGQAAQVIADARRDRWHLQSIAADGRLAGLRRVAAAELPAGPLLMPENFRHWSVPPRTPDTCSYDLAALFASAGHGDFFQPVEAADALQFEPPDYRKWSAQVHSAATAPPR